MLNGFLTIIKQNHKPSVQNVDTILKITHYENILFDIKTVVTKSGHTLSFHVMPYYLLILFSITINVQ